MPSLIAFVAGVVMPNKIQSWWPPARRVEQRIERDRMLAEIEDRTRAVRERREALEKILNEIGEIKRGRNDA